MPLTQGEFFEAWKRAEGDDSFKSRDVAWRRYQYVQSAEYDKSPEIPEPSLEDFQAALEPVVQHPTISSSISTFKFLSVPSSTIPWMSTGVRIKAGSLVTTLAAGRTWRSRLLDLFIRPQFTLYFRVGVNGRIFNSPRDTNTFTARQDGELYLAPQFPGWFSNPEGGRVQGALSAYDPVWRGQGSFQVLTIVWKDDVTPEHITRTLKSILHDGEQGQQDANKYGLLSQEVERLTAENQQPNRRPQDWHNLWFLGDNEIYSSAQFNDDGDSNHQGIRCLPNRSIGILQKHYDPALPFTKSTTVSWDWCITALPSRLREDTTFTHDYLSLAIEFENGRDLTYTWSCELPEEYGYWCPLPGWEDREYHVVIRSGGKGLGEWLSEKRHLYADYLTYIVGDGGGQGKGEGDASVVVPSQIVRVWLIAGNAFQRFKGEMLIRKIEVDAVQVL